MTIVKRGTKGTALTYAEMDENIRDLYEDTTIDRVLGNGNITTKNLTVGTLTASHLIAENLNTGVIVPSNINWNGGLSSTSYESSSIDLGGNNTSLSSNMFSFYITGTIFNCGGAT